jgi:glycerate 2-kinase
LKNLRHDAHTILKTALRAADAREAVYRHLSSTTSELRCGQTLISLSDFDRIHLLSVGKAAMGMATAVAESIPRPLAHAIVVTKAGHAPHAHAHWEIIEAGHPIPDGESLRAALRIREILYPLSHRDLVILAVSGGASALLAAPQPPVTLEDKQLTTQLLLHAGADIYELNAVRKHLSFLKGGRLAALAAPATVSNLLLSDVIGDPPAVIGSGLAAPDPSTFDEAISVLHAYKLEDRQPASVKTFLAGGARGAVPETPKANDPVFENVNTVVVGSNRLALEAASNAAQALGYNTLIHSTTLTGETREVAAQLTAILRAQMAAGGLPLCILSGGETTVTVHGHGKGGRNQEFALAAALDISGLDGVLFLSVGTDGTDGPTDAAGAIATGDTLDRARAAGLNAGDHLQRNDSYPFFETLGDLVKTGPTGTNVMDIQIMLAQKS